MTGGSESATLDRPLTPLDRLSSVAWLWRRAGPHAPVDQAGGIYAFPAAGLESGEAMVPKKKKSKCCKRKRRSHHALRRPNLVCCPKCSKMKLPHAACANCGYVSPKLALPVGEAAA